MATERKIVFWTVLSAMHWMNSCRSQTLSSDSDTCTEQDEIKTLKDQTAFLQQLVSNQAIETKVLKKELESVKEALSTLMPDHVAFHVVAKSSSGPGVIIFDHVISNIGSGYDITSGTFSVPTTGFYVFSWSIETYGQLTEAALLVNGLEMGISKSDEAPSYYDTTTSFAVLDLKIKDKVWVRVKSGQAEAMHTMFSGWKINKSGSTAFYASLSRDVTGSPITFNNEIIDTADAYSTTTGKFVAPLSGLYVFMMSGLRYGDKISNFRFSFSNGISQPQVLAYSSSVRYDSSGTMTFAWMNSGDYVEVDGLRMRATSMFAGWLLVNDNVSKSTFPAFLAHARLGSDSTPVVYDKAHGGYHHGYSTNTGVFTADRDGLYLFLCNTETFTRATVTALRVNEVEIFETRSDARHVNFDSTSAVTVLHLSSNDRVSIGVKSGRVDEKQSLFFGILLHEM
ncbi:uncharacterized protein LOC134269331 [Saccostrea cucullata]|uniref:uncharacterized protein LOC134269331 n=1 Tax=Saccostrea cuccullata TaxID=36930 RepID=UPI002ED22057